jgi:hypothetical protein
MKNAHEKNGTTNSPRNGRGSVATVFVGMIAASILVFHAAAVRDVELAELPSIWRYMDDLALATQSCLRWKFGSQWQRSKEAPLPAEQATPVFQSLLQRRASRLSIRPHEFWRNVPFTPFTRQMPPILPPPLEDGGRASLMAIGFMLLGGVSPYLGLWLGALLTGPALIWCGLELGRTRGTIAAGVLVFLLAFSPFIVESLTLPHSAVAFYFLALLVLLALACHCVLSARLTWPGFALRAAVAALVFAMGTICRATTFALLPAFLIALHLGVRRLVIKAPRRPRIWILTLAAAVLFFVPYTIMRPERYHNIWVSVWQGLGDYGEDRGYSWSDDVMERHIQQQGQTRPYTNPRDVDHEHERLIRRLLIDDISAHPLWYGSILVRRFAATVMMNHLLPWGPLDGESLRQPRHHYKYTTPADWMGLAKRNVELPVQLYWAPAIGLLAAWIVGRFRGKGGRGRLSDSLGVLGIMAAATLPSPVLISTSAGIETQAFVLVYFSAWALALGELCHSARKLRKLRQQTPAMM